MQIKYLCAPRYHHTHWISGLLCMRTCTETISKHFYIQKTEREERRERDGHGEGRRDKEIGTHIHSTSYSAHFIYYFAVAEIVVCFLVFDFYFNSIPWPFLLFICFKLYFPFVVCLKLSC